VKARNNSTPSLLGKGLRGIHPHLNPLPSRERKLVNDLPSRERRLWNILPSRERRLWNILPSRERKL
jgi:hypothetical protein